MGILKTVFLGVLILISLAYFISILPFIIKKRTKEVRNFVVPGLFIRSVFCWSFYGVGCFFGLLLSPFLDKYTIMRRSGRVVMHFTNFVFGMRVKVTGPELPDEPYFLWGNHQTNWDNIYFAAHLPKKSSVIGKGELKNVFVYGKWFEACGNVFIDRSNLQNAMRSMTEWENVITKDKLSPFIFPEATRNEYKKSKVPILRIRKGSIHVALNCARPIHFLISQPGYCPWGERNGIGVFQKREVEFRVLEEFIDVKKYESCLTNRERDGDKKINGEDWKMRRKKDVADIAERASRIMKNAVMDMIREKKMENIFDPEKED